MENDTTINTRMDSNADLCDDSTPWILVAASLPGATHVRKLPVSASFVIGRGGDSQMTTHDPKMSKKHLRITKQGEDYWIEDVGSTNGSRVNGARLEDNQRLKLTNQDVIRAGSTVMVFCQGQNTLLLPPPEDNHGFEGGFYSGALVAQLMETAISKRHVLIAGPSGVGKELAAKALARMMGKPDQPLPIVEHNSALFSSEEEAAATLFGIEKRVFSSVDERAGLVERAQGGVLFLDEVHNLSVRVQRTLLRVIEDGKTHRIGSERDKQANVRFVMASNEEPPSYSMAPDLLARLRVVTLPPLTQRKADIPAIFNFLLKKMFAEHNIKEIDTEMLLGAKHYEALCMADYSQNNVRGLVDLADRIATKITVGVEPRSAVHEVLSNLFPSKMPKAPSESIDNIVPSDIQTLQPPTGGLSHYETNKELIISVLNECGGNISASERVLRARGLKCSRRWLKHYAQLWGTRAVFIPSE